LQDDNSTFLGKWYLYGIRKEINLLSSEIKKVQDESTKKILQIILSRTLRSCRATTHSDLATLIEPMARPYYCHKHGKICKPLFSTEKWWRKYSEDTIKRISEFNSVKTNTFQLCLNGDSKSINIFDEVKKYNTDFIIF
jgi:hypothetical protein